MNEPYWKQSLNELLPDFGIEPTDKLIEGIINVAEMESEACGYLEISFRSESESDKLKKKIKDLEEEHRIRLIEISNNYAKANKIDPRRVHIDTNTNTMMFEH